MASFLDIDGVSCARATFDDAGNPTITFLAPSGFNNEGAFYPAESFSISGEEAVEKVQNWLDSVMQKKQAFPSIEWNIKP